MFCASNQRCLVTEVMALSTESGCISLFPKGPISARSMQVRAQEPGWLRRTEVCCPWSAGIKDFVFSCASVREASCCIHMLLGVGFHIKLSGFRPFAIRDFIVMQMCKPKQRETTGPDPGDCPRTGQSLAFFRNLQNSLVPTFSPFLPTYVEYT